MIRTTVRTNTSNVSLKLSQFLTELRTAFARLPCVLLSIDSILCDIYVSFAVTFSVARAAEAERRRLSWRATALACGASAAGTGETRRRLPTSASPSIGTSRPGGSPGRQINVPGRAGRAAPAPAAIGEGPRRVSRSPAASTPRWSVREPPWTGPGWPH